MSDKIIATRGRLPRLSALAKLCQKSGQWLASLMRGRRSVAAEELDDRLKRDIGMDPTLPEDRRTAHYRKMLQRDQPLS
ncbi:hypothetical protein WNZ14_02965 [Hoeflea sp. AS60]|uniref:hypothetical protein n=1 Tax=Hoeflea sp. AS60 TaxID=3135780 RepID=UPI00317191B5